MLRDRGGRILDGIQRNSELDKSPGIRDRCGHVPAAAPGAETRYHNREARRPFLIFFSIFMQLYDPHPRRSCQARPDLWPEIA